MSERAGVWAAVLSSSFGGMAAAVTRFVIADTDPVTLAALRFGGGIVVLLPLTLALRSAWPRGRDLPRVLGLGVLFFGLFFIIYNQALAYTTAARGALALSVLPLMTMAVGALLGVETLTTRKASGVLIAMGGVAAVLGAGLREAPPGAWRGDMIMIGATLCMALYNVWSRPFIARSSALGFVTAGMAAGAVALVTVAGLKGGFAAVARFGAAQWLAAAYLGLFGGAAAFFLWVFALARTTPTRVASTMTVNPIAASLLAAALIGEPVGPGLAIGVVAVGTGIWIATMQRSPG